MHLEEPTREVRKTPIETTVRLELVQKSYQVAFFFTKPRPSKLAVLNRKPAQVFGLFGIAKNLLTVLEF